MIATLVAEGVEDLEYYVPFMRLQEKAKKPIAIICHGGLIAISAGTVEGRRATESLGIKDELVNASDTWVAEAAFCDGNQVWDPSSRISLRFAANSWCYWKSI